MKLKVEKGHCSGCRLCLQICGIAHFDEINPKKAALRVEARFPEPGYFNPVICVQCGKCAKACPEEAITQVNGARTYVLDREKCTGCMACVEVCPFQVLNTHATLDHPIKCDDCFECAKVCNTGALIVAE